MLKTVLRMMRHKVLIAVLKLVLTLRSERGVAYCTFHLIIRSLSWAQIAYRICISMKGGIDQRIRNMVNPTFKSFG
mgnify:CR=1 FL=1